MSGKDSLTRRPDGSLWYRETLHEEDGFATEYRVAEVLYDSATPHQRLIVVDTERFGRLVALDGATQVTMGDEFVYHEMMAHVPLLAHGEAEDVLIIGGGDGGLAEEILKHRGVKRLVMVEIDPGVIDFARTHLADLNRGCFDDPRLELVIGDGKDYAAGADRALRPDHRQLHRSGRARRSAVHPALPCRLQAPAEAARHPRHPEWRAVPAARRAREYGCQFHRAVRRCRMLSGGGSDLCRRLHGAGLGQ